MKGLEDVYEVVRVFVPYTPLHTMRTYSMQVHWG